MSLRLPPEKYAPLKQAVFVRDQWRCRYCRVRQNLHIHHITYRSHGGEDAMYNLVTLCMQCHEAVHSGNLIVEWSTYLGAGTVRFYPNNGWRPQ